MFITEPKIALDMFNDERSQFLKESRKDHRKNALENTSLAITRNNILLAIEFIREQYKIDFTETQFIEISNLYPYEKTYLVQDDFNDCSETEKAVSFMICHFFTDSKMITFEDTREDDFGDGFYGMIKSMAEIFGYKIVK